MKPNRHTVQADLVGDSTFLPGRVVRAANRAMQEVLDEDRALRQYGIVPLTRSR